MHAVRLPVMRLVPEPEGEGDDLAASRPSPSPARRRSGAQTDDPRADLALVESFLASTPGSDDALADRLTILPRILQALNQRAGRPLDEHLLLDLVQDTGVVLLTKLSRYDGRVGLDGFIYGVARFEFLNAARRQGRRPRLVEDSELEQAAVVEGPSAEVTDLSEAIKAGLRTLPDDELQVVRLKHFDDLTFSDIAGRLGCSPNSAKTRYYRAIERLRAYMEPRRRDYLS